MNYSKVLVPLLWFIFAGIFFFMSWKEYGKSNDNLKSLEKFNVKKEGGSRFDAGFSPGEAFYAMREEFNKANKESHRISAQSFLAAGLTALLSFILSFL